MLMDERESLAQAIKALLPTASVEMTTKQLAAILKVDRTIINSVLYEYESIYFQKARREFPPKWKVVRESTSKSGDDYGVEKFAKNQHKSKALILPSIRACSLCGAQSEGLFCSKKCRKRSLDIWYKSQFKPDDLLTLEEFLKFYFQNLTAEFEQPFAKVLGDTCTHAHSAVTNLMNFLETHTRDVNQTIECLTRAYENLPIDKTKIEDRIETKATCISVANISTKHRPEVLQSFQRQGLTVNAWENVSQIQIANLPNLSAGAKKHLATLFMRREELQRNSINRCVDNFTMRFLGISEELIKVIELEEITRLEDFEQIGLDKKKSLSEELLHEFDDLLLAVQVHTFLPTLRMIANLELGIPEVLISEESAYRAGLITALHGIPKAKSNRDIQRLIRMLQVLNGVAGGKTLDALALEMGVTRERVRQMVGPIFAHVGVDGLLSLRAKAQLKRQSEAKEKNLKDSELEMEISNFIRKHPGISVGELNEYFPMNGLEIQDVASRHRAIVLEDFPIPVDPGINIRDDMIQSLKDASLLAFPLTGNSYDELLEQGLVKGVSRQRIMQVFGTWNTACEYAEVEPGSPLRNVTYVRTYSPREMLRVVGQFLIDDDLRGYAGGVHRYGGWRASQEFGDSIPSDGTIRNQVNRSWKRVKDLALVELRSSWVKTNSVDLENLDE